MLTFIDTSVVLLLAARIPSGDADTLRRAECARERMLELRKRGANFVVPTPVLAELGREGSPKAVVRKISGFLTARLRFEDLDHEAAVVAAEMSVEAMSARPPGAERGAVKYDALIAAIAHVRGGSYLVTANAKDFSKCLSAVNSPVKVLRVDVQPSTGQLLLLRSPAEQPPTERADNRGSSKPQ